MGSYPANGFGLDDMAVKPGFGRAYHVAVASQQVGKGFVAAFGGMEIVMPGIHEHHGPPPGKVCRIGSSDREGRIGGLGRTGSASCQNGVEDENGGKSNLRHDKRLDLPFGFFNRHAFAAADLLEPFFDTGYELDLVRNLVQIDILKAEC